MKGTSPRSRRRVGTALLALLILAGCAAPPFGLPPEGRGAGPRLERLEQGAYSLLLVDRMRFRIYTDARSFAADYRKVHAGTMPGPDPPSVDFGREVVAAVYLGRRPTAGYAVDLVPSAGGGDAGGWLNLTVRVTEPPEGALVAQVLTSPYVMVRVPRKGWKGIHFRDETGRILKGLPIRPERP